MALEAMFFQQDLFGCNGKDAYYMLEDQSWSYGFGLEENEEPKGSLDFLGNQADNDLLHDEYWSNSSSSPAASMLVHHFNELQLPPNSYCSTDNASNNSTSNELNSLVTTRAKRQRSRSRKNKEEIENQRMTHIAVERNRRKQMNEYLSVLRSLMPESYVQRGDQASIIGGAINYVRELEHRLHLLAAHGENNEESDSVGQGCSSPFAEAFKFPQFSMSSNMAPDGQNLILEENSLADIEVSLVESHASLKIRSKRRPKLLLKVVSGLQSLGLTILHLNVSTVADIVLYCFSAKVDDDCKLTSVADIATAVYQMLTRINQENAVLVSQSN